MAIVTSYPTRPLECWKKMKELRRELFKASWGAKEMGGLAVATQNVAHPLVAGLGVFGRRLYGPYFSKAMREPDTLLSYHQAADARGFPRGEMCSSMHHYLGEMALGLTTVDPVSGSTSPVDFVLEAQFCHSVGKMAQIASEALGVPHKVLDIPQQDGAAAVDYVAAQMADAVDWMVKVTGREYHDEWLAAAVENWWEHAALWAQISLVNQAVPAPVDVRMMGALEILSIVGGHDRRVVDFFQIVLDEMNARVADGIAANGMETCRLTHEGEPMYYDEGFIHKLAHRYGAVFVAGFVTFCQGLWNIDEGGRWTAGPRFGDLGLSLRSREDALRLLARCYVEHSPIYRCQRLEEKPGEYVYRAQDWHCDGAVLHMDIGCHSQGAGVLEARQALERAGIPTVTYEASNGDPRDFSHSQVTDQLESFLERLGLVRLE
ncbi:MAG: 2-hydroxyacyl-CoA dehydratase family protein [Dehalococcoidia bacterium]|nr:2-hydroxyacyl-CoA dehydratase family protein [Dehalococcoidia bacterium]MDP7239736.1 2-hydroxyacyl-CoA dehydratase family protein [Dehalococcoidia bacterium]MDP7469986.1 2-hydroxyacyl-CoA dehydratase family protein [Dehalococcoidia bacterium]